jgi:hypothetical protein
MKDFYSMSAFFRNTSMSALDGNNASHAPVIFVPAADDRKEWNALPGKIAEVDRKLAEREKLAQGEFQKWLPTATISVPALDPASLLLHFPLTEAEGPVIGKIGGKEVKAAATVQRQDGIIGKALRVDSAVVDLGKGWDLKRQDAVTIMARVFIEGKPNGAILAKMASGPSFRGWDLFLEQGKVATHAISDWQENADKIASNDPLEPGKWHHIAVTFNGPAKKDRQAIYVNGKAVKTTAFVEALRPKATIENDLPLLIGSRNGGDSKVNGVVAMQDLKVVNRLLTPQEIGAIGGGQALKDALAIASDKRSKQQTDLLYQYYLSAQDSAGNALRQEKASLTSRMAEMKARGSDSLVMDERPNKQPYAHILTRGEYTAKADKVDANTPSALPPLAPDAPRNRLGLAKWLVNPANPLPARVTVNRVWAYLIGNGIVETTGDFGIMGARPTHPELLDWLAASFVESKWDHRRLVKAIVTSATYRQSAAVSPEKLEKDPFNRLLARGARPRLDGEQIRDMALAASGLLVDKVGGAPVRPYQPEGIWESVAMKESNTRFYKPDEGDSLYRRSLYTIWKRIAPHPTMEILNAPSREVSCVRRDRTNTPLQAFVTMNDPQFVESAKFLAVSTLKAAPDFDGRLNYISNRLISRVFTDAERAAIRGTFDKALATFQAQPAEAAKYLATGAKAAPADLPAPELAAWTFLASQVLNLDEALAK